MVAKRLGTSSHIMVADLDSGTFAAVENAGAGVIRGAGAKALVAVLESGAEVLVTGYCSPMVRQHLEANGVQVLTGLSGRVEDVVRQCRRDVVREDARGSTAASSVSRGRNVSVRGAATQSWNQFRSMLPMVAGVVMLVGLLHEFVPTELLASLFTGNVLRDTLAGACAGSILAGNPVTSYIIGAGLLEQGVSLFAVTALILTWVTVGLVQLPAEIAALGWRFAIFRTIACFVLAFPVAIATVLILMVLKEGASLCSASSASTPAFDG